MKWDPAKTQPYKNIVSIFEIHSDSSSINIMDNQINEAIKLTAKFLDMEKTMV